MDRATVFTKTAKGITQVNQRSASLPKDLMKVLKLIDGKSNFGQLMEKAELDKPQLEIALTKLTKDGFARIFETRKDELVFATDEEDEFDFTSPKKQAHPGSTQRVAPAAANDISELARQHERTESDRKAREQAHEAARVKAKAEAEARAKLEAEARAKQEAEERAMEQARRAKEASERARLEVEAKQREEEARQRALAEQQAKLTAEQKAREEAESRRLAELRAKAESEARALAEARARAEAEAQALARARAEAEAAAKRKAEEANSAEREMKARLKEEIEARIRAEMEDLLRNEIGEKARAEMHAQIMEEAKLAARAELEERLREERQALASAEREARSRAEKDARERGDREAKLRAEAEARAQAEAQARMRAEADARMAREEADRRVREQTEATARMEAEARVAREEADRRMREQTEATARLEAEARVAREEAHKRAREQAEIAARLEVERKGKIEAEARAVVEAEERERRERELTAAVEAERRAKETIAEDVRVQVQAELESDLEKRAQIEGKAQARAYMEAKAKAEAAEEQKLRDDQERKAREIADILRTKVEPDAQEPTVDKPVRRRRARGNFLRNALVGAVLLVLVAIGLLHVVPLRPYGVKLEQAMSAWLHDDVSIGAVTFRLLPSPHLNVTNVAVGKTLDAKAARGDIYMDISSLFGERPSINAIDLDDVTLNSEAVKRIATWGRAEGRTNAIERITLRGVRMDVKPQIGSFNATLLFSRAGELREASLASGGGWSARFKPGQDGTDVDFSAHGWALPAGVPVPVADATLKGKIVDGALIAPEFEASTMGGKVTGALKVTWAQGVHLESDLTLQKVSAQELVSTFTKDIAITGKLDGEFRVAADAPSPDKLFAAPRVQGRFRLTDGSISNVDLVAVMQSSEAGQRAGVTKFAELTGEYGASEHRAAFKQVNLQGGVLRGNGAVELHPNSTLTGRATLEIRSQVAQDRGAFSVSGTVSRPVIRRGG
jgi:hypothetical protein